MTLKCSSLSLSLRFYASCDLLWALLAVKEPKKFMFMVASVNGNNNVMEIPYLGIAILLPSECFSTVLIKNSIPAHL